jgi:ABC-2 type transport system ATP-binding protein
MTSVPAILVTGLVKRYPVFGRFRDVLLHPLRRESKTALAGVDLRVERGRCFCLLGPNGAGKTTLIKILTTLVLPDEGKAFVGGCDVEQDPVWVRRRIGFAINEERSFYWRLTGRQNLEFFGALNGLRGRRLEAKIAEVVRLTNLEEAAGQRFNTYSTGMRQMLAFARALMTDADILFVDEPTRSLDPQAAARVRAFLKTGLVAGGGKTVFWATHNLAEAAEVAHEIAIIDRGRIRVEGSVAALTEEGGKSLQAVYDGAVSADDASGEGHPEEGFP